MVGACLTTRSSRRIRLRCAPANPRLSPSVGPKRPKRMSALETEFGGEATEHRLWLEHLDCYGTQIGVTIEPQKSEDQTLQFAWQLVQRLAQWLIGQSALLPANERYQIIVGWSPKVRAKQGQIFKTGGSVAELHQIIEAPTSQVFDQRAGYVSLRPKWQKDVFNHQ